MTDRWTTLERRELFSGAGPLGSVRVDRVRVRPGVEKDYVVVAGPEVALVVPVLDDGRIALVRQFRYAWGAASLECPAGHLDPGESPEDAARRELEEEAGLRAGRLERLLPPFHASAKLTTRFHAFVARELAPVPARPDEDEDPVVEHLAPGDIRAAIARGDVLHGPSLLALFAYLSDSSNDTTSLVTGH